jgi:sec-independent protein translocase protein TatA
MGGLSIWHWIVVGAVAFIFFGGKFKISDVMGDFAKGIKAFKKGMAEDEDAPTAAAPAAPGSADAQKSLEHRAATATADTTGEAKKV